MSTQPRQLSDEDKRTWLDFYGSRPDVSHYLATGQPPYGIHVPIEITGGIVEDFVLYIPTLDGVADPANLHIVLMDPTDPVQSSFLTELEKAPYKSPDDVGFWENFQKQLNDVLAGAATAGKYILVGLGLLVLLQLTRK